MLMNGSAQYTEVEEGADFIELVPIKKGYNPPDSQPRVFSTHLKLHHLPKQVLPLALEVVSTLQALVYDILPSTTAVFSYAIGSRKLSVIEQFFCFVFLLVLKH